jgi:predicted O-linked N-acetylglucosamine transferase (SPINDLY family)
LRDQGRHDEANASLQTVMRFEPKSAEAYYCVGQAFRDSDHHEQALDCFRKALALKPEYAEARWAAAMQQLPAVYAADADPLRIRTAFSLELDELDRWFDATRSAQGFNVVGSRQPFFLAYQEENNRDLLRRHGGLCARLMADWFEGQEMPGSDERATSGLVRVGVVSRFFSNHSVWNAIVRGWFQRLDRRRFVLDAFYLGTKQDQETLFAASHASHFERGVKNLRQWVDAIIRRRPDVLIYPEIGMDPMTLKLASLRLAPVQVATWGHPETTGLSTIDYYLSAEDLEPAGAQSNYTERLVTLPHLGCFYEPREVTPVSPDLGRWGIVGDVPLILCPGVPFKYAPQYDWIFPEIARRLGRCRLIFFTHQVNPNLSEKLQARLALAFARKRLNMEDFLVFLPWQNGPGFYGLLRRARVFLDTIGFSGFNTAMQAVECGLPIVTREGRFLRGRLASGILKRMGLRELVARTEEDYVALAVRLVQDAEYREHLRERIEKSRYLLFEDTAPIRALEDFLARVGNQVSA